MRGVLRRGETRTWPGRRGLRFTRAKVWGVRWKTWVRRLLVGMGFKGRIGGNRNNGVGLLVVLLGKGRNKLEHWLEEAWLEYLLDSGHTIRAFANHSNAESRERGVKS